MLTAASFVMCTWSLITMWLMSEKRYRPAWISSFFSQIGWALLAWQSGLWGMFVYSFILMALAVRAFRRLDVLQ